MADLLLDIVSYFTTAGLVQGDGIDTFRDFIPANTTDMCAVYEYAGLPEVPQIDSVTRSIQVVAVSLTATTAKLKARQLHNALLTEEGIINLTSERWCMVHLRQPPFKIKTDEMGRIWYGFNAGITTYND